MSIPLPLDLPLLYTPLTVHDDSEYFQGGLDTDMERVCESLMNLNDADATGSREHEAADSETRHGAEETRPRHFLDQEESQSPRPLPPLHEVDVDVDEPSSSSSISPTLTLKPLHNPPPPPTTSSGNLLGISLPSFPEFINSLNIPIPPPLRVIHLRRHSSLGLGVLGLDSTIPLVRKPEGSLDSEAHFFGRRPRMRMDHVRRKTDSGVSFGGFEKRRYGEGEYIRSGSGTRSPVMKYDGDDDDGEERVSCQRIGFDLDRPQSLPPPSNLASPSPRLSPVPPVPQPASPASTGASPKHPTLTPRFYPNPKLPNELVSPNPTHAFSLPLPPLSPNPWSDDTSPIEVHMHAIPLPPRSGYSPVLAHFPVDLDLDFDAPYSYSYSSTSAESGSGSGGVQRTSPSPSRGQAAHAARFNPYPHPPYDS